MSLAHYIANAKEKPEHVRRKLALIWSLVATAVIALVWILNLNFLFQAEEESQAAASIQAAAPLSGFKNSVGDEAHQIKAGWNRLVNTLKGN